MQGRPTCAKFVWRRAVVGLSHRVEAELLVDVCEGAHREVVHVEVRVGLAEDELVVWDAEPLGREECSGWERQLACGWAASWRVWAGR